MKLVFAEQAWQDYLFWQANDPNGLQRINDLIKECMRNPFQGTGKPEPLKAISKAGGPGGSRLRIVSSIASTVRAMRNNSEIAQCRFHYDR